MSKKVKRVWVDPPSGWAYGFPKPVPEEYVEDGVIVDYENFKKWLSEHYPGDDYYMRILTQEHEVT